MGCDLAAPGLIRAKRAKKERKKRETACNCAITSTPWKNAIATENSLPSYIAIRGHFSAGFSGISGPSFATVPVYN
jgi:hypothetical protein